MVFSLRFRELNSVVRDQAPDVNSARRSSEWNVIVGSNEKASWLRLSDPFTDPTVLDNAPEKSITWYLEEYTDEPFETTKADAAAEALSAYGRDLAAQIVRSGLLPTHGDIRLEIKIRDHSKSSGTSNTSLARKGRDLQQLHWEVLEDVRVWPPGYSFESVSVIRSVRHMIEVAPGADTLPTGKKFKILLVVARPRQKTDVDHQLVSGCLVAIIDHVSKTFPNANISLKVVRPSTWQAFTEHLHCKDEDSSGYDVVHFDMHGKIKNASKPSATAGLEFCRPDRLHPLQIKKDFKTGDEIGKELAKARVKTVILNACKSASFQSSTPASNLAETLLGYGVKSVLAMAYKVVDEAVENFMNVFYQSLLIDEISVQDAVRLARLALMTNRSRRTRYMHSVQLSDYIVPVLYTSCYKPDQISPSIKLQSIGRKTSDLEKVLNSFQQVPPLEGVARATMISVPQDLIGRGTDILSLELLLSTFRLVLLRGQGGCGKSELLQYVCRWWKDSGWISGSAYIDFADGKVNSLEDFVDQIGDQLGIDLESRSEAEIIRKLKKEKILIVLDSVDALDTPISIDFVVTSRELPTQLKSFIDAAISTRDGSMVIVSSRQDKVHIANIKSEYQKYHLTGLSVFYTVDLLQHLALRPKPELPDTFHRRENVDFLRRVAILLEGNPAAVQMIVPAFRLAKYDGETLLNMLLYGVCETNHVEWKKCRFVRSIHGAINERSFINQARTLVHLSHLAAFWTLMPKDLIYYYWFFYLRATQRIEGSLGLWMTQAFQDNLEDDEIAVTIRQYWPGIEEKLLHAGILEHAVVKSQNGESVPCYHVHPILTLIGRSKLSENGFKDAKFGYVRQILLWDKPRIGSMSKNVVSATWDRTEQHEDYVHNMRAVAMAWSLDGDLIEEAERMGLTMFHFIFARFLESLYANQRQLVLFIPLIRKHLSRVYTFATIKRPGGVPTSSDLDAILTFSWEVCRFETEENRKLPIVSKALQAVECHRASGSDRPELMAELSWFQLRHLEASIAESNSTDTIYRAKKLYERNLADDPSPKNKHLYSAIRHLQLQNLTGWASCVVLIAAREGRIEGFKPGGRTSYLTHFCTENKERLDKLIKPGAMTTFVFNFLTENKDMLGTMTVRDQFSFSIEQDELAVSKFGTVAKGILDAPILDVFATASENGTQDQSSDGISSILRMMKLEMDKKTGDKKGPAVMEMDALFGSVESYLHMVSGNTGAAESAIKFNFQREALSSTASTRWEYLADYHMQMYGIAVTHSDKPDYRKGLTHLEEWWKQHRGIGISKLNLCYGHLKFATCYNGLNRVTDAAREVITCAQVVPTMTDADCAEGSSVELFSQFLYDQFATFDKLEAFQDSKVLDAGPAGVAGLSRQERVELHEIMNRAWSLPGMKTYIRDYLHK